MTGNHNHLLRFPLATAKIWRDERAHNVGDELRPLSHLFHDVLYLVERFAVWVGKCGPRGTVASGTKVAGLESALHTFLCGDPSFPPEASERLEFLLCPCAVQKRTQLAERLIKR